MDMLDYGFMPERMPENISSIPARVIAVHKERYALVCEHGEIYGRLKTKEYYGGTEQFPTTGDFVLINYISNGDSQIVRTLPRKSFFSRRDPTPGRGEQAVAANFDYVFIMQSLNQDFSIKRLERYLTLAWQSGAVPAVILTKADLVETYQEYIAAIKKIAPDVAVHIVSAKTQFGLDEVSAYMQPRKTIVFLGSSGVGKSSLVNALAGENLMNVNEIREKDGKGHHTTTHRQLILLKNGAMIIDTPGMRELGMWDVSVGLEAAFSDVEQYLGKCKFNDCRHLAEPGCAIREAIERGELSEERWESYRKLRSEAIYTEKQQRNKKITKNGKQRKLKREWSKGDFS